MADEPTDVSVMDTNPTPPDPDVGAKKALQAERERARKAEADAKAAREELARLKASIEGGKTEAERMAAELASLREELQQERWARLIAEVAQAKGLKPAQAKWLARAAKDAKNADEIAQIADEFVADLGQAGGDTGEVEAGSRPSTRPTAGRPREALRPGAIPRGDSGGDQPFDESKFLAAVPRV